MILSLREVVRDHYNVTDDIFFFSDIFNAAKSEVNEGVYRTINGHVSLRSLLTALVNLPPHVPLLLPRTLASDRSTIFLSYDPHGHLMEAKGIGIDGISRRFTIDTSVLDTLGVSIINFFEGTENYLSIQDQNYRFNLPPPSELTSRAYSSFRLQHISVGNYVKDYELTFDAENVSKDNKADISFQGIYPTDLRQVGQVDLNVPSFASVTFPFTPALTTVFKDEVNRTSYFAPLFRQHIKQYNAHAFSALQVVGLSYNSSPATLFSMPMPTVIPISKWEVAQAIAHAVNWGTWTMIGSWVGVSAASGGTIPIAAAVGIFLCGFDAVMIDVLINHVGPPNPPNPNPGPGSGPDGKGPMPAPVPIPQPDPCNFCFPDQICVNGVCYDWNPPPGGYQ